MVKAHFHDKNIVLGEDGWEKVPDDAYGSPPKIVSSSWKSNQSSIVVLIASLRERRLAETIISMMDNAANKNRIYAVIVQQNLARDTDIIEEVCQKRQKPVQLKDSFQSKLSTMDDINLFAHKTTKEIFDNVNNCFEYEHLRVLRLDSSQAKGPVYARGLQATLVNKNTDEFCMQIDAHTVFKKDWDWLMQQQYGMTENEYAVLSTYPTNYKDLYKNSNKHWEMPHLCGASISGPTAVRNHQAKAAANLDRPILAPLWAAGLSFSKCHAELNVPNDIHLEHIFTGEEFARGARLWTHGYDFYSITRPIIGVYYGGDKGGRGGWKNDKKASQQSYKRIGTLLKAKGSDQSEEALDALGKYGLGTRRTLEQYYEFSGVDVANHRTESHCIVKYVPWAYDETLKENNEPIKIINKAEIAADYSFYSYLLVFVFSCFLLFESYKKYRERARMPLWKRHLLRQRKQFRAIV